MTPTPPETEEITARLFPIMGTELTHSRGSVTTYVPWALMAPHNQQAQHNHGGQTLERLAERGGLSACEAVAVLEDRRWTQLDPKIAYRRLAELVLAALRAETQARQEAETQLAEAASRINCAGPVAHRIDVLKVELRTKLEAERVARQQADARIERLITESKGYADALRVESEARQQAETVLAQSVVQRELQESVIRHETQRREQAERERNIASMDKATWLHTAADLRAQLSASEQARQAMQRSLNLCEDHQPDRWEGDGTCVLCGGDCLAVLLRQTEVALAASEQARDSWRSWAQFVYLGGGPVSGTDKELQAAVCAAQDARETSSLTSLRTALEKVIAWRDGPEGPEVLFHEGVEMMQAVREALSASAGTSTTTTKDTP